MHCRMSLAPKRSNPALRLTRLSARGNAMVWKKNHFGECAYCPKPATTKDHVPPRGIFAKNMPNKPWVPACESCNGDASKDDEYMQRLSMLWGADACDDAVEVGEKFMRSLNYPEAKGLQAELHRSLTPLEDEALFPGGINMALQGERLAAC